MSAYQITPPDAFTFSSPINWPKWKMRFERYRLASGLSKQSEEEQVNSLIYCMGEKAEDIFIAFSLNATESKSYSTVINKFTTHFEVKKNVIFERAQFNTRSQEEGEPVNDFITALYTLAEKCEYGNLHDELIRDRIVVGLRDKNLSEKLQLDSTLTLAKAIEQVRLSESVKKQQEVLQTNSVINNVNKKKNVKAENSYKKGGPKKQFLKPNANAVSQDKCKWCGYDKHEKKNCPAKDATCKFCSKRGHYFSVCRSRKSQISFLGYIGGVSNAQNELNWSVSIIINGEKLDFKIDSGADHTVIPYSIMKEKFNDVKVLQADKILCGPDKRPLDVHGKIVQEIKFSGKKFTEDIYIIKGLQSCLLGKPAIQAFGLGPNLSNIGNLNVEKNFPDLFSGLGKIDPSYTIELKPEATPFAISAPRRIPIPLLKKTKAKIKEMVDQNVIAPVSQPTEWCAPVVVVPKKDKTVRICVDLTELNKNVKREVYPLPSVEYTLNLLSGAKVFSKLDANSGFYQIPLSEESSFLTTFITPFGRFRFLRLPFGISSAPEHFQRRMTQVLEKCEGIICHMDDILVWGCNQEEHDKRLHEVLKTLKSSGLTLNKEKCQFSKHRIKFLGHILDDKGIHPDNEKLAAIKEYKPPKDKSELKQFLGMAQYLSRFVPNYSDVLNPLTSMLSAKREFVWDSPQEEAFQKWKQILLSEPVLQIFDPNKRSIVTADASSYGIGATLRQEGKDGPSVVAYASRTLTQTEQHYAQIEKEALALAWASEKFRDYITGTTFKLETDHKPLLSIFTKKSLDDLSPRLQRIKMRMMRYSYSIFHTPGKKLFAADALSRSPREIQENDELEEEIEDYIQMVTTCHPAYTELHESQMEDPICKKLLEYISNGWPASKRDVESTCISYWPLRHEISLQNGLLMRGSRIIIPEKHRNVTLKQIHEGHLGISKCRARARTSVFWPGMSKQIEEMVKDCSSCIKEHSNRSEPLLPTHFPDRPWEVVGLDLFKLQNYWYLLITDYYSRYPEIARLNSLTSSEVIIHCKSIFARHGIPDVMRSDNGPQFEPIKTREFIKFRESYGFKQYTSSPHYPQSNGFIESSVKTIKMRIKKSEDPYLALMVYRATPLENGLSPSEMLFNRRIKTNLPIVPSLLIPKEINRKELAQKEERRIKKQENQFNRHHRARELEDLQPGDKVWMCDMKKPAIVEEKTEYPRSYIVNTGKKKYRRNRQQLNRGPNLKISSEDTPDPEPADSSYPDSTDEGHSPSKELPPDSSRSPSTGKLKPKYVTRSGRSVRPPDKLTF